MPELNHLEEQGGLTTAAGMTDAPGVLNSNAETVTGP
jgi:hypothetical protein